MNTLHIEDELFAQANTLLDIANCDSLPTNAGKLSRTIGKFGLGSVVMHFPDGSVADLSQEPITDSMPKLDLAELQQATATGRIVVKGFLLEAATDDTTSEVLFPANEADIAKVTSLFEAVRQTIQYL